MNTVHFRRNLSIARTFVCSECGEVRPISQVSQATLSVYPSVDQAVAHDDCICRSCDDEIEHFVYAAIQEPLEPELFGRGRTEEERFLEDAVAYDVSRAQQGFNQAAWQAHCMSN